MIDNEFTRQWLDDMVRDDRGGGTSVDMETIEPQDIANAVAWLVSDAAKHITGVTLPVDAGYVNKR
jgi:NAD(P)-dependent dehydrogenase (short-subunit alcohol dehydrogenase family)